MSYLMFCPCNINKTTAILGFFIIFLNVVNNSNHDNNDDKNSIYVSAYFHLISGTCVGIHSIMISSHNDILNCLHNT